MEVALVLTHACNMACHYCYAGEKKSVRMSRAVLQRALEVALAGAPSRLQLTFFGGEPLLEKDRLLEAARTARRRAVQQGTQLVLQVTTNGTRLDAATLGELRALDVRIALSMDGTREAHEAGRPFVGGASSYRRVDAALARLLAAGRPFDVIMVVDPSNVAHLGASLRELLDRGVRRITLNANWGAPWDEAALARWREGYELAAALTLAWHRRGRDVTLQPLRAAMQSLAHGRLAAHTCGAGVHSFAVAPSGRVYGCARSVGEDTGSGALGHIDAWPPPPAASGPNLNPACRGCASAGRCERHCACACREETSDPQTPGPVLCWHQHMLEEIALRLTRHYCAA